MQSSKQAIADSSTKLLTKEETTISLDNSRPGRSGLDELVPSRYALKVGEIDVIRAVQTQSTVTTRMDSFMFWKAPS